jgi:outer membrane murein-binding lipoprotein Lpp
VARILQLILVAAVLGRVVAVRGAERERLVCERGESESTKAEEYESAVKKLNARIEKDYPRDRFLTSAPVLVSKEASRDGAPAVCVTVAPRESK